MSFVKNTSVWSRHRPARPIDRTGAALVGAALMLAACGGSDTTTLPSAAAEPVAEAATAVEAAAPAIVSPAAAIGETALGEVLIGERGLTLYGFTNDADAASVCYGACADAWPPLIVGPDWSVAPGLDGGIFNATVRDDGQLQLVAGKWPLYYFAGDTSAGDLNGQTSGDVWFAVGTDGLLIEEAVESEAATEAPEPEPAAEEPAAEESAAEETILAVTTADSSLGPVLVDADGFTLYGFTNDVDGNPTCNDACADAWPPLLVEDSTVPAGLDDTIFSVVTRDDGSNQLSAGVWPLYYFAGDGTAGDTNGQASGDVWFAITADGGLVKETVESESATEAPEPEPAAEEPAAVETILAVTTADSSLGPVLVDADGFTLYGFTNDVDGNPTCNDACADAWPPLLVEDSTVPAGLDDTIFSVVTRDDGSNQLSAGVWPLYYFAGDGTAGDTNGQASGDVWFAITADGGLVKTDDGY